MSGSRPRRIVSAPWVDLTAAILRDVPRLDGALCAGRAGAFDGHDGRDGPGTQSARALCARCPALPACTEWVSRTAASRRPRGVVAGQWRGSMTADERGGHDATTTKDATTADQRTKHVTPQQITPEYDSEKCN